MVLFLAACGSLTGTVEAPESDAAAPADDGERPPGMPFGQTVTASRVAVDGEVMVEFSYTVNAMRAVAVDDRGDPPDDRDALLVFDVFVEVLDGELAVELGNISLFDALPKLLEPNGYEYDHSYQPIGPSMEGTLTKGESATGTVVFDVLDSAAAHGTFVLESFVLDGSDGVIGRWSY